jgi:hypothetical protein
MNYIDDSALLIRSCLSSNVGVPEESEDLFRVYAVLARAKGKAVTATDVHDAWSAWMTSRDANHPSIIPFEDLDEETRKQDYPFVQAIHMAVSKLR